MSVENVQESHEEQAAIPRGQIIFDNLFLFLALSIIISLVLYNLWGILEVLTVPPGP